MTDAEKIDQAIEIARSAQVNLENLKKAMPFWGALPPLLYVVELQIQQTIDCLMGIEP